MEAEEDQEEDMEAEGEPSGVLIRGPQGTIMCETGTGMTGGTGRVGTRMSVTFSLRTSVCHIFSHLPNGKTRALCSCVWIRLEPVIRVIMCKNSGP